MKLITVKPQKKNVSGKASERKKEIDACFNLEPDTGYFLEIDKPESWKSQFYSRWKELRDKQEEKQIKADTLAKNPYEGLDYLGMDFSLTMAENGINIWKNK